MRPDVSRNIFLRLLILASDQVRERLNARYPKASANIARVVRSIANEVIERTSLMILKRAQEFSWNTARAILRLRTGGGDLTPLAAEDAAANFERIDPQRAQKVPAFYRRGVGTC